MLVHAIDSGGGGANGSNTDSCDITGATDIFACTSEYVGGPGAFPSDNISGGTGWVALTSSSNAGEDKTTLWYKKLASPATITNFSISYSATGIFATIAMIACDGIAASSQFDIEAGASTGSAATSLAVALDSPNQDGSLLIFGFGCGTGPSTFSVDNGFTVTNFAASVNSVCYGVGMAWKIQTTAGSITPGASWSGSTKASARVAAFKPAAIGTSIAVPAGSMSLSGIAASLAFTVGLGLGSIGVTGQAPTVVVAGTGSIAIPAGSINAIGQAPRLASAVVVPIGSLSVAGQAPSLLASAVIQVPVGTLDVRGWFPAVTFAGPDAGSIDLIGWIPTVVTVAANAIAIPAGSLGVTGRAPTLAAAAAIPSGSLTMTGVAPVITFSGQVVVPIPAGSVTLSGQLPALARTVAITSGSIAFTGQPLSLAATIAVPTGALTVIGDAPTLAFSGQVVLQIQSGAASWTGYAPTLVFSGPLVLPLLPGAVSVTGYAPTVQRGATAPRLTAVMFFQVPTAPRFFRVGPTGGRLLEV